jgi:hypothetical protein
MNIRIPRTGQAAKIAQTYLKSQGLALSHSQSLELVARLHGYASWHALEADIRFKDAPALKPISSNEYELGEKERSAWIGVANISVSVTRTDEGVAVDLYAKGCEDDSLAGTSLFFHEAQADDSDMADTAPSFTPVLVDWSRVAANTDICGLSYDANRVREIVYTNDSSLEALQSAKGLALPENLAKRTAFSYSVADANGVIKDVLVDTLHDAMETSPGEITLKSGQVLRLFEDTDAGIWNRYSPALDLTIGGLRLAG